MQPPAQGPNAFLTVGDITGAVRSEPSDVVKEVDVLCASGYAPGKVQKMGTGGDLRPWFLTGSGPAREGYTRSEHGRAMI